MKVLVTGGAGFVGANLVRNLLAHGDEVVVIDDLSTGYLSNIADLDIEFIEGSILNDSLLTKATRGVDSVVHLAAIPSVPRSVAAPLPSHEANATGTLKVLEAVRNSSGHVLLASSSSVYGNNPTLPKHEELRPMPISPYAVSKLAAESYALAWQATYGIKALPFRFFNVFGPLQAANHAYAAVLPSFLDAIHKGQSVKVYGDGTQTRDFTYVGDVVNVLTTAVHEQKCAPTPVNLAFGTRRSLNDVLQDLATVLQRDFQIDFLEPRIGDVKDSQADSSKLLELFGALTPTNFQQALQATADFIFGNL